VSQKLFVVAVSQKEAEMLAPMIGHRSRSAANEHLREVQATPTDPFYAKQYKVFEVAAHPDHQEPR
jgi:hypothetical protein